MAKPVGMETTRTRGGRAAVWEPSPDIHPLSIEECWRYLRSQHLGRVTITAAGRPHIFPVNYAIGGRTIVFRTAPGAKLEHGPGSITCFEVDGYNKTSLEGWSVMAFGILEDITGGDDARSRTLRHLPVRPVAPGIRMHWMAMRADHVTGRYFRSGWIVPGAFYG